MQIEYKKEWMDTYLWILPEVQTPESYEEKMIRFNPGGGRLEFTRQEKEGEEYFCYKVTGKKALNSIYAALPMGERQIRSILGQLFDALEEGKECLLSEKDFLLSPGYIFATLPQMQIEFCYMPGYGVPLQEQLEGLFEYLLNRVDYEDKTAVNLLYDCYMFCMKEKGGLTEIKKRLTKEEENKVFEPAQQTEPVNSLLNKEKKRTKQDGRKASCEKEKPQEEKKAVSGSYVSWLTEKIFPWKRREMAMVAEEREEYLAGGGKIQKEPPVEESVTVEESDDRTILLSSMPIQKTPELICGQTGEVIPLTKFPYYIGCAGEYADYVTIGEGVSRIHCCISKREDKYYLSDLNSTNGTFLNGKEISPGKDMLLSEQDEIKVASQEFYIKFPCF